MPERETSRNVVPRPLPALPAAHPPRATHRVLTCTWGDHRSRAALAECVLTHPWNGRRPPASAHRPTSPRQPYRSGHRHGPGRRSGTRRRRRRTRFRDRGRDRPLGRLQLCTGPLDPPDMRLLPRRRVRHGSWARSGHGRVPYAVAPVGARLPPAGLRTDRRRTARAAPRPAQPHRQWPAPRRPAHRSPWAVVAAGVTPAHGR